MIALSSRGGIPPCVRPSLSVCHLSISLSISLTFYLSVCMYVCLSSSNYLSVYPNLSIYLNPSTDYLQCESNKNVGFTAPVQKYNFFCATLLYGVFFNIFWKFLIYLVLLWSKKKFANPFFSQNQKFRKAKMCILTISIEI